MSLPILSLLCLLQVWSSSSRFVFEFELRQVDVVNDTNCDEFQTGQEGCGRCEPYLHVFCLREETNSQSTNFVGQDDCPLGRTPFNSSGEVFAFTPADLSRESETRPGLPDGPVNRTIMSEQPWPGTFQLYIPVRELDPPERPHHDVHLDFIFINRDLAVSADFTPTETYYGNNTMKNITVVDMRFRVICQQDYYGANCTRFCRAQNDRVNGYYTCNSDGSIQCREGFRNTDNNCTEVIPACESSPCANGGNCTSMGPFDSSFTCQCAVGYTGSTCEVNIDDCASVTCPSNSMCDDRVNAFECVCLSGFEKINGTCVMMLQTGSTINTGNTLTTNNITDIIDTTDTTNIPETFTSIAAIGGGVAAALVVVILLLIIIIVVLILVLSKRRAEKPYQEHQGEYKKDKDNSAYQLEEKLSPTAAIYATPSSPEATFRKLENPVYGEISDNEDDANVHDFQNPVYGDTEDSNSQQDELYTAPQAPQSVSLGMEGDGPEYDYATNPGVGAVTVNMKTNGSTPVSHEYTVMDETNREKVELDVMEPYEKLHHGTEPPGCVRLAEVEGAEYGSLQ